MKSRHNSVKIILILYTDIEEIHRPSLDYAGSMMQLVKLPKELKIPFDELEFEAKMIGEGNLFIHPFIHSLIHLLIHPLIHLFINSHSHSLTPALIPGLTHSSLSLQVFLV